MTRLLTIDRPQQQRGGRPTSGRDLMHSNGFARASGFTLTEILIALAITALLLVGISRIFGLTSATIGSGQSLSKALRSHKAIQSTISTDIMGSGDLGRPDYESGMLPLVNTLDAEYASPFLAISSMRTAAYKNAADAAADAVKPVAETTMDNAKYIARSRAIRGIDLNGDGDESDVGELTPLYQYGDRNFRIDTFSFFGRGNFQSQTGMSSFTEDVTSREAWIWYGHLRVFNSDPALASLAGGHGSPGDLLISNVNPNRNHLYADDFRLGRYAMLLVEPMDIKGINTNLGDQTSYERNTVVANGDVSRPVPFVRRNWWRPAGNTSSSMLPIGMAGDTFKFLPSGPTAGQNRRIMSNEILESQPGASTTATSAGMGRTDIAGAGLRQMRQRTNYQTYENPTAANRINWRMNVGVTSTDRFYVNPFPAQPFDSRGLSRRQQLLADSCSQFIVEYAGDFVQQNATGAVTDTRPDGEIDFVVVGTLRQTRWYGMPRDVDGDGVIAGWGNAAMRTSTDVVPLGDFAGTRGDVATTSPVYPFERAFPPITSGSSANYMAVADEPTGGAANPNLTQYVCVWGPSEFDNATTLLTGETVRPVPQLLRIIVDVRDPGGRIQEAVTQEMIVPVRVSAAIRPVQTQ